MKLDSLLKLPIIQGPMAGGYCTPELVAAVSNAGGLGALPGSLLSPSAITEQVGQVRALTDRPFALNFFIQETPQPTEDEIARGVEALRPVWEGLGWTSLPRPAQWCQNFNEQFETLLALRPAIASFTFGILTGEQVRRLHAAGILVMGTVTTVDEARAWEEVGADAVIASGTEAGGHRGTFLGRQEDATLPSQQLWPAVAQAVRIPMVAAGGIMTGADINAALAAGARAVQMGTAFLVTQEAGTHPGHRQLILSGGRPTRLTRSFSGRYARGIDNRFMQLMQPVEGEVPAYPVQNALTGSIRAAAASSGNVELMSLWAGTHYARARAMPASELVQTLVAEMRMT